MGSRAWSVAQVVPTKQERSSGRRCSACESIASIRLVPLGTPVSQCDTRGCAVWSAVGAVWCAMGSFTPACTAALTGV